MGPGKGKSTTGKSSGQPQGLEPTGLGAGELCSVASIRNLRQWGHSVKRHDSHLETTAKRGRQERNSLSPRNVSAILIPDRGSRKGSGALPHCSPDRNREVTPGQKAGALRIHGALHGRQRAPSTPPVPEWWWGGGRGGRWRAHYCHTSSFLDTQKTWRCETTS